jgi:hypothetical protein
MQVCIDTHTNTHIHTNIYTSCYGALPLAQPRRRIPAVIPLKIVIPPHLPTCALVAMARPARLRVAPQQREHTSAYVSQHTSASISQHTTAYVSIRELRVLGAFSTDTKFCRLSLVLGALSTKFSQFSTDSAQHLTALPDAAHRRAGLAQLRQHTSAYVSIRQHTSAYVKAAYLSRGGRRRCQCQHTSAYVNMTCVSIPELQGSASLSASAQQREQQGEAWWWAAVVDCPQASQGAQPACVSIRQHTSAYGGGPRCPSLRILRGHNLRKHTPYVSIRQHTSAYVSIRQHTPAYASIRQPQAS